MLVEEESYVGYEDNQLLMDTYVGSTLKPAETKGPPISELVCGMNE